MKQTPKNMLIYSNDFKFLQLPKLTELELKAFLAILFNLQGQGNNEVRLYVNDLFLDKVEKWEYRTKIMDDLRKKFISFAIRKINETPTHIIDETTLFFKKIRIHYRKENPDDGYDTSKLFECVDIQINEEFVPYINDLKKRFTQVEMEEILSLSGYRNVLFYLDLKTFKITGEYTISLDEFKARYYIPENYRISEIRRVILKPLIKELSRERTLFDQKRTPFENLKFTTIKGKGKVVKIKFTFKPQGVIEAKINKIKKIDSKPENEEEMLKKWQRGEFDSYKFKYTKPNRNFDKLGIFRLGKYDFMGEAFVVVFHSVDNPANSQTMTFQKGLTQFKDAFKNFEIVE